MEALDVVDDLDQQLPRARSEGCCGVDKDDQQFLGDYAPVDGGEAAAVPTSMRLITSRRLARRGSQRRRGPTCSAGIAPSPGERAGLPVERPERPDVVGRVRPSTTGATSELRISVPISAWSVELRLAWVLGVVVDLVTGVAQTADLTRRRARADADFAGDDAKRSLDSGRVEGGLHQREVGLVPVIEGEHRQGPARHQVAQTSADHDVRERSQNEVARSGGVPP